MELFDNLLMGLSTALQPNNLLFCLIGVVIGTAIGVLPGIGPIPAIALLLPFTFGLSPPSAMIMLAGIFYGAQYGGSTTAILVNVPGETSWSSPASTATRWPSRVRPGLRWQSRRSPRSLPAP